MPHPLSSPLAPPLAAELLRALTALVLPVACAGCGASDAALCPVCRAALLPTVPTLPTLPMLPTVPMLPVPTSVTTAPVTYAALAYTGAVREVIVAWKDHDRPHLGAALAPALAVSMAAALGVAGDGGDRPVLLVPVPSSAAARRRRGTDTVAGLTRRTARLLTRETARAGAEARVQVAPVLRRRRSGIDQVGLSAAQRRENVRGAVVAVSPAVAGRVCVLVDDVVTTGASLAECARALREAGAAAVAAATVAATPRRASPLAAAPTGGRS